MTDIRDVFSILTGTGLSLVGAVCIILYVGYRLVCRRDQQESTSSSTSRATTSRTNHEDNDENVMRIGNRVIRNRHSRANPTARRREAHEEAEQQQQFTPPPEIPVTAVATNRSGRPTDGSGSDFDVTESDSDHEVQVARELPRETVMPTGKIGKMKRLKLEMKAERRAMRERELLEREERRQQQEQEDEIRRKKEEEQERREREREEAEKKAKEEQERREYEEYLKLKQSFQIEEQGYDASVDESEAQNKLLEFIETIRQRKIVLLEELAAEFKMKTQDVIDRIQQLLDGEQLTGVLDDRGKFIYITEDELQEVAKFIRQRGRVSIVDLVENSNNLIKL